jgi:hypothetical protein
LYRQPRRCAAAGRISRRPPCGGPVYPIKELRGQRHGKDGLSFVGDSVSSHLLFQTKGEHPGVVGTDTDIASGERDSAVVIPTVHGIATCIEFVAGGRVERIEHGVGCVAAARVALAGLLSAFLEGALADEARQAASRSKPGSAGFTSASGIARGPPPRPRRPLRPAPGIRVAPRRPAVCREEPAVAQTPGASRVGREITAPVE